VRIPDSLESEVRRAIGELGWKKGALTRVVVEALEMWLARYRENKKTSKLESEKTENTRFISPSLERGGGVLDQPSPITRKLESEQSSSLEDSIPAAEEAGGTGVETGVDAGVSAEAETPEGVGATPISHSEGVTWGSRAPHVVKLGICKHQRFMDKLGASVWCAKLRRFMSPKYCRICPERERGEGVSEAAAAAV